jgi:hypothetical protein
MGERGFLSWPAGWRRALPWAVVSGAIVVAAIILLQASWFGWNSLDRIFWLNLAIFFPFVVLAFTLLGARFWAKRGREDDSKSDAE